MQRGVFNKLVQLVKFQTVFRTCFFLSTSDKIYYVVLVRILNKYMRVRSVCVILIVV